MLGMLWQLLGIDYEIYYPVGIAAGIIAAACIAALVMKKGKNAPLA